MKKEKKRQKKKTPRQPVTPNGARIQFAVASSLISIIPLLVFFYLLQAHMYGKTLSANVMWILGVTLTGTVATGYAIMIRYPITIMRLRHHMELIAKGEIPEHIKLQDGENDITAIEEFFNMIIEGMKDRIETIKKQDKQLMHAERQRVMTESLHTACHCLCQPASTIGCYLDLLAGERLSEEGTENLSACIHEAGRMRDSIRELQSITEYETEPYVAGVDAKPATVQTRIIPTRCDKAAQQPTVKERLQNIVKFEERVLAVS